MPNEPKFVISHKEEKEEKKKYKILTTSQGFQGLTDRAGRYIQRLFKRRGSKSKPEMLKFPTLSS